MSSIKLLPMKLYQLKLSAMNLMVCVSKPFAICQEV